ncbi:MAG TPA: tRNA 2-thiouridine(34) synthase MnmA [Beijerinckiaceae bacterium]|nr:tRNA 2-thiouridine(34) synthase MnmA [Beijerinckiaceae bacterium]
MNSLDLPKPPAETRVVVAMSGGVDSSVVAVQLASEGYDVVGVTLQLYDHAEATHRKGACCAGQDIQDARRVAEHLGIPHYVLDYESRFRDAVIDAFAASYAAGETPVPCIECNRTVKFRDLLAVARDLGADALATGHYIETRQLADGRRAMFRPADQSRDQSYFLYATTQDQLDFLRFPLGRLTKAETREIARGAGIAVADKPDSQDICFVPQGRYDAIVEKLRPEAARPGDIVHLDGRVLGRHQGVHLYTIGQRRGLGLATGEPLHVIRLDAAANRVMVGPRSALSASRLALRDFNWLGDGVPDAWGQSGFEAMVRVRSTRKPCPALLHWRGGRVEVEISGGEEGIAPGQACVVYGHEASGARVFGGGTIDRVLSAEGETCVPAPAGPAGRPAETSTTEHMS